MPRANLLEQHAAHRWPRYLIVNFVSPFAPVRIVGGAEPNPRKRGGVTVRWPQGLEVEIAAELDRAAVERLVQTLLAPCLR